ncbi:MAG: hypothetical protein Q9190_007565 [Brigantiaea leucoxantha]
MHPFSLTHPDRLLLMPCADTYVDGRPQFWPTQQWPTQVSLPRLRLSYHTRTSTLYDPLTAPFDLAHSILHHHDLHVSNDYASSCAFGHVSTVRHD